MKTLTDFNSGPQNPAGPFQFETFYTEQWDYDIDADVLQDGRVSSHVAYSRLLRRFTELKEAPKEDFLANCLTKKGHILLVRAITKSGLKILPSKHLGFGRFIDMEEHEAKRMELTGYILVDVTLAPTVSFAYVHESWFPAEAEYSVKEAQNLMHFGASRSSDLPKSLTDTVDPY